MTAPALNPAQFMPPGLTAPANGAARQAAGPQAGFEALMAALFPTAQPEAAPTPQGMTAAAPLASPPGIDAPASPEEEANAVAADEALGPEVEAVTDPATLVPADYVALPASVTVAAAPETSPAEGATLAPEGKADAATSNPLERPLGAKPRPGRPELAQAPNSPPAVSGEAAATELAEGGVDAGAEPAPTTAPPALPESAAKPAAPPAWGTHKIAGAPAAPALANANANARLAEKSEAPAADVQPDGAEISEPVVSASEQPKAPATFTLPQRAEAPPAALNAPRAGRVERAKASAPSTADGADLRGRDDLEAPAQGKATDAVAKAAAPSAPPAPEPKPPEATPATDAPDTAIQAEPRASETQAAPAEETTSRQVRGAPETVANLAAQIVKKLEARTTRFDVELDPQGLGKVDVRVEIGAHGRITAAMTFDNPQAAQDVKARSAELQRALEQAGFDLSGSALSFDVAQDQGRGQGRAWQDQNEAGSAFRGQAFRAALETAGDADQAANPGALRLRRGVNSGLDLRI